MNDCILLFLLLPLAEAQITSASSSHIPMPLLPYRFYHAAPLNGTLVTIDRIQFPASYIVTSSVISSADFLVFDQTRTINALGSISEYELVFNISVAVNEAPVFVVGTG